MANAGLLFTDAIVPDGCLHRGHVKGDKPGSRNGWYLLHLDGRPAGAFGSWRTGLSQVWTAGRCPSAAERTDLAKRIATAKQEAESERRAQNAATSLRARRIWDSAQAAQPTHPYLLKKGVRVHGLRRLGNLLLVPLLDTDGQMWNLQQIRPDGAKLFLKGGRVSGLLSPIGELAAPQRLILCEGWATAATLHEETGDTVIAAMNAGNLLAVARAARARWPSTDLVIAADNDRGTPGNPGLTKAREAALEVGARLAVPEFPEGEDGSDFNDLAALRSKGARHA